MNEQKNYILAVDMDSCPLKDNTILYQGFCKNCDYYVDHKMVNGKSCIECSYPTKKADK